MKTRKLFAFLALLTIASLVLVACGPKATPVAEEPMEEETMEEEPVEEPMEEEPVEEEPAIGSEEHPIKVLFVPSVDVDFIITNADIVAQAFSDATGLVFEASVPTSYAATIEEMCASPTDTIAFIPGVAYALASDYCGVEPGLAAARNGWTHYFSAYIVQRDSGIETLEDLEGKNWGFGSATSTSGYLYPKALLEDLGITIGEQAETGGHSNTVLAVYNGEVDFGTVYFSPPQFTDDSPEWKEGDSADVPDELISECGPDAEGNWYCGYFKPNDARNTIVEQAPDVYEKVKLLALTPPIPNDTMSFSPEFPDDIKQMVMDGVIEYVRSDACAETFCAEQFYEWTDAGPITDEVFDGIRVLMAAQGITMETIDE